MAFASRALCSGGLKQNGTHPSLDELTHAVLAGGREDPRVRWRANQIGHRPRLQLFDEIRVGGPQSQKKETQTRRPPSCRMRGGRSSALVPRELKSGQARLRYMRWTDSACPCPIVPAGSDIPKCIRYARRGAVLRALPHRAGQRPPAGKNGPRTSVGSRALRQGGVPTAGPPQHLRRCVFFVY